jgi:hypothetical protein
MLSGCRLILLKMLLKEEGKGLVFFYSIISGLCFVVILLTRCISGPLGVGKTLIAVLIAKLL